MDGKILAMNNLLLRFPANESLGLLSQVSAQWQTSNNTTQSHIQICLKARQDCRKVLNLTEGWRQDICTLHPKTVLSLQPCSSEGGAAGSMEHLGAVSRVDDTTEWCVGAVMVCHIVRSASVWTSLK